MIQIDEDRLLTVSQHLHFGTVGVEHVRNIINCADEAGVLESESAQQSTRFLYLYRGYGAAHTAKVLGLRREVDVEVLREYFGVRQLTSTEDRLATEQGLALNATQRILLARQGQGGFPEFDEARVFAMARGEVGDRSKLSPAHMRQVIAEARGALGLESHAGTDPELSHEVVRLIRDGSLRSAAYALSFSAVTDGARERDLYYLRLFLGLHEMGPERGSRVFAHREVGERREFNDYVRAED